MEELMKAIIHNRVLLCVVLSKLGMEDDEIDNLNKTIANSMESELEKLKKSESNDEEDKDIPLIPNDELWNIEHINICGVDKNSAIDYNFKVLKEKINQVVEEFNEYRKENEENEKQKEKKQRNGI